HDLSDASACLAYYRRLNWHVAGPRPLSNSDSAIELTDAANTSVSYGEWPNPCSPTANHRSRCSLDSLAAALSARLRGPQPQYTPLSSVRSQPAASPSQPPTGGLGSWCGRGIP